MSLSVCGFPSLGRMVPMPLRVGQCVGRSINSFSQKQLIRFFWNCLGSWRVWKSKNWCCRIFQKNSHFGKEAKRIIQKKFFVFWQKDKWRSWIFQKNSHFGKEAKKKSSWITFFGFWQKDKSFFYPKNSA